MRRMPELKGKVIAVTGAGSGIGRALALGLARRGATWPGRQGPSRPFRDRRGCWAIIRTWPARST
jgi:hypothetical protein